jgi:hypothetical protein
MTPEEALQKINEQRENQRERTKKYYEKNKEKCRDYGKEYYRKRKELLEQAKQMLLNSIQDSSQNLVV